MPPRTPNLAKLAVFWFGVQMVWGALLGVSLQARAIAVAPAYALAVYGTLATGGAIVAALTQIIVGPISDRRRRRGSRRIEFYAAGAVVAGPALFWFYSAGSVPQLVAALVVIQLGMNLATGPYQAAIPDFVADRRFSSAAAWMAALQSLGNAAGAIVAGFINEARAIAGILCTALLATCAVTAVQVRNLRLTPVAMEGMRISRAFADLFISRALVYVGFYTLLGYLLFYVRDVLAEQGQEVTRLAGVLLLLFTLAAAAGAVLGSAAPGKTDRRAVASIGGCVFVGALFAFLAAHLVWQIGAAALLAGLAWGIFLSADWALGCRFLPRAALATAMAVWNLALLIPQIVAPAIATAAIAALHDLQNANGPKVAFVVAALEVAAGIAWLQRLPAFRPESGDVPIRANSS